jgi:HEAT repeat protein
MKKIWCAIGILCFVFVIMIGRAQMKIDPEQEKKTEEYYSRLRSSDLGERYLAAKYFSQLNADEISQRAKDEVIDLFTREAERVKRFYELARKPGRAEDKIPKELLYLNSEEFAQYYGYLAKTMGKSRDERALPLLVENYPDPRLLNNFGDLAVDPVINAIRPSDNESRRHSLVLVLRYMLEEKKEGYVASGVIRSKIKQRLIECAISDKSFVVRTSAVRGLGGSGDQDLIPALEKIAMSDPYHFETKAAAGIDKDVAPGQPITRYPVRLTAQEALKKLREGRKKG